MNVLFEQVNKGYPSGFVLNVDNLEISSGERVGLVGNNGAGKTTLMLLLLGLLPFSKGDVFVDSLSARSFSLARRRKTGSYLGESSLISFLNPWEYWQFVGDAYGLSRDEQLRRIRHYDGFVEVPSGRGAQRKYIRDYSQGSRKKIGLLAAVMVRPGLLVLDEPFSNLDPRSQAELERILRELNAVHDTMLFVSSHDLFNIVELSSRILLIEDGSILYDGDSGPGTLPFIRNRLIAGDSRKSVS